MAGVWFIPHDKPWASKRRNGHFFSFFASLCIKMQTCKNTDNTQIYICACACVCAKGGSDARSALSRCRYTTGFVHHNSSFAYAIYIPQGTNAFTITGNNPTFLLPSDILFDASSTGPTRFTVSAFQALCNFHLKKKKSLPRKSDQVRKTCGNNGSL